MSSDRPDLRASLLLGLVVAGLALTRFGVLNVTGVPTDAVAGGFDFRAFYTAAWMVWNGQGGGLLDLQAQAAAQATLFSDGRADVMGYFNPPLWAGLMAPLAALRPGMALAVWQGIGDLFWLGLMGLALLRGAPRTGSARVLFVVSLIVFPAVLLTRLGGQLVPPLVVGLAGCVLALDQERPLEAGLWLTLCMVKPHLGLLAAGWAALVGGPRVAVGAALGVLGVGLGSLVVAGPQALWEYPLFLVELAGREGGSGLNPVWETTIRAGLRRGFGAGPVVDGIGLVLSGAFTLFMGWIAWRERADPGRSVRALVPVMLLVPLHTLPHDHALWLVPLLLWRPGRLGIGIAIGALVLHWVGFIGGVWPAVCLAVGLGGAVWAAWPALSRARSRAA